MRDQLALPDPDKVIIERLHGLLREGRPRTMVIPQQFLLRVDAEAQATNRRRIGKL